jgi:hypothetical protein
VINLTNNPVSVYPAVGYSIEGGGTNQPYVLAPYTSAVFNTVTPAPLQYNVSEIYTVPPGTAAQ